MNVQQYRRGGKDCFYPEHPLYASAMRQNAVLRGDTRDVGKWTTEHNKAVTGRLRGLAG